MENFDSTTNTNMSAQQSELLKVCFDIKMNKQEK